MLPSRRSFLKKIGGAAGTLSLLSYSSPAFTRELQYHLEALGDYTAKEAATNDDFWSWVRNNYSQSTTLINLNNGGVSPQPRPVQSAQEHYTRFANEAPSYFMWRTMDRRREALREQLADLAGCSADEIAVNRNATESLDTIIFGLNLKKGDEVVVSNFDYPNMMNAWNQREMRDGVVLKRAMLDLPSEDKDDLIKRFTDQFTSKTKVVHITHLINWTGQILPAREIAAKAKERGIKVIIDGAHSFAHLEYKIPELGCDYFGTSLHKWLCAPFGTGMLYVKKENIADLWPFTSAPDPKSDDIRKFESLGTRSFPAEFAVADAIDFHYAIGSSRKYERLQYLKQYWMNDVKDIERVKLHTSIKEEFSGALATFSIEGIRAMEVKDKLMNKYSIHTTSIKHEGIEGVRVTPHVYTLPRELDKLINAIHEIAK